MLKVQSRRPSDAAKAYGKQIGATIETQNYAGEVRLRAERKLGEMLKDAPKAKGAKGRGKKGSKRGTLLEPRIDAPPTLASVHITKKQSSRAQDLASMPEADFEAALVVEPGKELNHNRVVKAAKETRQRNARKSKRTNAAKGTKLDERIIVGDFRKHADKVADGSLSLIFTDPPYDPKPFGYIGCGLRATLATDSRLTSQRTANRSVAENPPKCFFLSTSNA